MTLCTIVCFRNSFYALLIHWYQVSTNIVRINVPETGGSVDGTTWSHYMVLVCHQILNKKKNQASLPLVKPSMYTDRKCLNPSCISVGVLYSL